MKRITTITIVTLLLVAPIVCARDAVVGIYSDLGGRKGQGTGFFFSPSGDILTAYHVIEGSRSLEIFYEGRRYHDADIVVKAINPDVDLAHLQIRRLSEPLPYYPLASHFTTWTPGQELHSLGYLRGIPNQYFEGYLTQKGTLKSGQIRDKRGQRLFERSDVDLLPVYIAGIYSGSSGGPILLNGQAVGVLSGSLGEGGSFTWGIPISYMAQMQAIDRRASQVTAWPKLALMNAKYWNNLRAAIRINSELNSRIDNFFMALDSMIAAWEDMFVQITSARNAVFMTTQVMRSIEGKINASTTPETLYQQLEPQIEGVLLPKLAKFKEVGYFAEQEEIKLRSSFVKMVQSTTQLYDGLPRTERNISNVLSMTEAGDALLKNLEVIDVQLEKFQRTIAESISQVPVINEPTGGVAGLRQWLTSFRSGLEHIHGMIGQLSTLGEVGNLEDKVKLWRDFGQLCERMAYQEWDKEEYLYRYYSSSNQYSIVMPRGWAEETPGLMKFFTNLPSKDPSIDLHFIRTGHYGDQVRPPGFDSITTTPVPAMELSDLYALMTQSDIMKNAIKQYLPNLRNFRMVERQIAGQNGLLVTGDFDSPSAVGIGRIYYALVRAPTQAVWIHCTIHSGAPLDDCQAAVNSFRFE